MLVEAHLKEESSKIDRYAATFGPWLDNPPLIVGTPPTLPKVKKAVIVLHATHSCSFEYINEREEPIIDEPVEFEK